MAALSNLLHRCDYAARWRVGLLAVAAICAAPCQAGNAGDSREARAYLDAHNAVRAAVERPARYTGPWASVPPVTWSDEVAGSAQAWADQLRNTMHCGLRHDSGTRYGENLAAGRKVDAEGAVRMWAGEMDKYGYSPRYAFERDTGHYTQLVWRKTTQIGCGRARCGRDSVVVCRYSPAGNYIGRAPY